MRAVGIREASDIENTLARTVTALSKANIALRVIAADLQCDADEKRPCGDELPDTECCNPCVCRRIALQALGQPTGARE